MFFLSSKNYRRVRIDTRISFHFVESKFFLFRFADVAQSCGGTGGIARTEEAKEATKLKIISQFWM